MTWILIGVIVSYVLVNSPLIYSLLYVHGRKGTGELWGYAPNQFLFLVLFFPFAAFCTFAALRLFIIKLYPSLPLDSKLSIIVDHWPIAVLIGLIIAALFTILVYFTSGWSFDKLHPNYAQGALVAAATFESKVAQKSSSKDDQNAYRRELQITARHQLESAQLPVDRDPVQVEQWLSQQPPEVYLQVVQSRQLPHRLRLLHPAIHVLNVFQLLIVLFVASVAVFVTLITILYGHEVGFNGTNSPAVSSIIGAVAWAVFFFSFYIVCYHQYRSQMEDLAGSGTTILQDVLVGIVVAAAFVGIMLIDPGNRELSVLSLIKFALPVAFVATGIVAEETLPHLMRQLIGKETTLGFQVGFSFIFGCLALIPVVRILVRD